MNRIGTVLAAVALVGETPLHGAAGRGTKRTSFAGVCGARAPHDATVALLTKLGGIRQKVGSFV